MFDKSLHRFVTVAKHGSIRRAAGELHVAQSALSRHVANLEELLGVKLFERHARGVKTTDAGDILLHYARNSLELSKRVTAEIDALKGLQFGCVKLHTIETLLQHFIPVSIARIAETYPGISFDITIDSTDRIVAAVLEGHSDLGLVYYPPRHRELRSLFRLPDPLMAIVNSQHPLARASKVSLRQTAAFPIGVTGANTSGRSLVEAAFKARNLQLSPVLITNSTNLLLQFVGSTNGVAFLSHLAPWRNAIDGSIVAVPVSETTFKSATVEAITPASRQLPIATEAFLRVFRSELESRNR